MSTYIFLKALHVLGVVLFLGNITVTAWWKNTADHTRNPAVIAFAQRQVILTDWAFTAGGAILILAGGWGAVFLYDIDLWTIPWLLWGHGLFVLSGLIWLAVLIPVQRAQARMARGFAGGGDIPDRYWNLCRIWNGAGSLAILLPLIVAFLMVVKPV